jgi:hypothetical protein
LAVGSWQLAKSQNEMKIPVNEKVVILLRSHPLFATAERACPASAGGAGGEYVETEDGRRKPEAGREKTKDKSKKTKVKRQKGQLAVGSWQLAEGQNEMKILCK